MAIELNSTSTNLSSFGMDVSGIISDDVNATSLTTPVIPTGLHQPVPRRFPGRGRPMPSPEFFELMKINNILNTYITLPIMMIGLVANIVLIYAIKTSRLKNMAYTVIVCSLAGGECGYLLTELINWPNKVFKVDIIIYPGVCQISVFIMYCFRFLPLWYMLGLLAERCRALCIIYMRKPPNVKFRVRLYIFLISSFAFLIYSICLWAFTIDTFRGRQWCMIRKRYLSIWASFMTTDIVFSLLFPIIGIAILYPFDLCFFVINHIRTRAIRDCRDKHHSVALAYRDEKWFTISVLVAVAVHIILLMPSTKGKFLGLNPSWRPSPVEDQRDKVLMILCLAAHAIKPFIFLSVNPALRKKISRWFQPLKKLLFRGRFVHNPQRVPTNLC